MELVAHDPEAAKRLGIPQSVGRDFVNADKAAGKKFSHNDNVPHDDAKHPTKGGRVQR